MASQCGQKTTIQRTPNLNQVIICSLENKPECQLQYSNHPSIAGTSWLTKSHYPDSIGCKTYLEALNQNDC